MQSIYEQKLINSIFAQRNKLKNIQVATYCNTGISSVNIDS